MRTSKNSVSRRSVLQALGLVAVLAAAPVVAPTPADAASPQAVEPRAPVSYASILGVL